MGATFDLTSEDLRVATAETKAWCAGQQLTAYVEETDEIRKHRILVHQASKLMTQAHTRHRHFWNRLLRRDLQKTLEWQLAMKLSLEAGADSLKLPLATQLRSLALEPNSLIGENRSENERKDLVFSVVQRRSNLLRSRDQGTPPVVSEGPGQGRMLIYVPEENVADGASEAASSGFFDLYDAPPWDIWVAYSNRTLLVLGASTTYRACAKWD